MTAITVTAARDLLVQEGYLLGDINTVLDQMVDTGLQIAGQQDTPAEDTLLTAGEVDVLRAQLALAGEVVEIDDITAALDAVGIEYAVTHPGTESASVRVGDLAMGPARAEGGARVAGVDSCDEADRHDWHSTLGDAITRAARHAAVAP